MQKIGESSIPINIHGILQQRRLWHVQAISLKNIMLSDTQEYLELPKSPREKNQKINVLYNADLFYCVINIHEVDDDDIYKSKSKHVFTSEKVKKISNPKWTFQTFHRCYETSKNRFSVQLWLTSNGTEELVYTWNVKLKKLVYIGENVHDGNLNFLENTIIFNISGSLYSHSKNITKISDRKLCPRFDLKSQKISSGFFTLKRIVTNQKIISQRLNLCEEFIRNCQKLNNIKNCIKETYSQMQSKKNKILLLKNLLAKEKQSLKTDIENLNNQKNKLSIRHEENESMAKDLSAIKDNIHDNFSLLFCLQKKSSMRLIKLREKQKMLLEDLSFIFPISDGLGKGNRKTSKTLLALKAKFPHAKAHSICNIYLPESENMSPKEDDLSSSALGYSAQVVHILSILLFIPLRYPVILKGSQCLIIDNISEKLQDHERVFSLWGKGGKDRYLFDYAVYLLNKNIAQFRYYYGLPTTNLRPTLLNIKTFLEHFNETKSAQLVQATLPRRIKAASKSQTITNKSIVAIKQAPPKTELEKRKDKAENLQDLRGELFGNKKAKTTQSPNRSRTASNSSDSKICSKQPINNDHIMAPHNIPHPSISTNTELNVIPDHFDVDSLPIKSNESSKNLTGLEELEDSNAKKGKLGMQAAAARSELFSTKYGRTTSNRRALTLSSKSAQRTTLFAKTGISKNVINYPIDTKTKLPDSNQTERTDKTTENSISNLTNGENVTSENLKPLNNNFESYNKDKIEPSVPNNNSDEELDLC